MKVSLTKMWRSGLALLLAICLVAGFVPGVAFAAPQDAIQKQLDKVVEVIKAKTPEASEAVLAYWEANGYDEDVETAIAELREYIGMVESRGGTAPKQWCEIYMRISIPLASFFFAMIGAALGTQKQRTSSSIGLGISIIVIFIYYAVMTFTTGLGKGGAMPPFLACMLPNMLCLGIGLKLLKEKNS